MSQANTASRGFEKLEFTLFASPGFGLVFAAPANWRQVDDARYLQVIDPESGAEVTASAYENNGLFLEQWATLRNSVVARQMPYLTCVRTSYGVKGLHVSGIGVDYQGVFPDSAQNRHYLVLCLRNEKLLISVSLTTSVEDFAAQEEFYRWLLQNKLDIYTVEKVSLPSQLKS